MTRGTSRGWQSWLTIAIGSLALGACGGDSAPRPDTGQPADTRATTPDAARPDQAPVKPDAASTGYGEPCTLDGKQGCGSGLFCLKGPAGGNAGFCTQTCPPSSSKQCTGTPAGTAAFCIVTDANPQGDKACAFVCAEPGQSYKCPGELVCQSADDPPGSGQRLCLPK